jgi:hypothetical protein
MLETACKLCRVLVLSRLKFNTASSNLQVVWPTKPVNLKWFIVIFVVRFYVWIAAYLARTLFDGAALDVDV